MKKIILFLGVLLFACNSPYSLDKFKSVLDRAKLQAPYSKFDPLYSVKYGKFKDVCHEYFYLQDNKYMVFFMCQDDENEHKRCELRFKDDFKVNENHLLKAKIKIFPLNQQKEFTFLQIHTDNNLKDAPKLNKPLLRIAWMKQYHNIKDHIWAIIRLGTGVFSNYSKIDLGKRPEDFFDVTIKIKNSKLSVLIDDEIKINNFDISYWDKYYNYFKAGVYLQGIGCAKVLFDKLVIK